MQLFYTPDISGDFYILNDEESNHCTRVLRLAKGDEVYLTNGRGDLFRAIIADANRKNCSVQIVQTTPDFGKRKYRLHLAVAPTKNPERYSWFLEKATEIGIDEITPLICEHSERRNVNLERFNRVISSAMKQSLKAYHPLLNQEERFSDFVRNKKAERGFICYCGDKNASKLTETYSPKSDSIIMIGPEGDFSEAEFNLAKENGFVSVS